ncbi:MAG: replication protein DnaC [Acidobacteriaceae bacterium]|jgi:DNA replication protein DnaC|nr:replication protein DnaC [Acidobacteriaceae bacterium]
MAIENCPLCRGTGWRLEQRVNGVPGTVATACDCGMEERAVRVMERARIPKRYEHCDFESYVADLTDGKTWMPQHAQSMKQAKMLTQGFVRDYPGAAEKGLLLMGPSGVGKTHLAVAALKELIRRGHGGLFCDYRELLKEIQASYNPASESTEMRILEPIRNVEILVLDDLGASKPSDWVRDIVGIVLNARYNENRTTVITTNYVDNPVSEGETTKGPDGKWVRAQREDTLEQRIGSRMRSRLYEMCRTVEVIAPDFRREKTQAGRT